MNLIAEISKAIARISNKENFIIGMDFFINRLNLLPYGKMTKEQLEALYLCSNDSPIDTYIFEYEKEYKVLEETKTTELWNQMITVMKKNAITFNDTINLSRKDTDLLIRKIRHDDLIAALSDSPEIIKEHFFYSMSPRLKEITEHDLINQEYSNAEVEDAKERIVETLIYLIDRYKMELNRDDFITPPEKKADFKFIEIPQKIKDDFWYSYTKTGISAELRRKIIENENNFFNDSANQEKFIELYKKIEQLFDKTEKCGILALEEDIEKQEEFTQTALALLCDGVEFAIIDEILSTKIIQERDINTQFLKYIMMRSIMYLQNCFSFNIVRGLIIAQIPYQFDDFKKKIISL